MCYVPLERVHSLWQLAFRRLIKSMRSFIGPLKNMSSADVSLSITFFFNLWCVHACVSSFAGVLTVIYRGANRWLSVRFSLLSAGAAFICAVILVYTPLVDASLAGFALSFVLNVSNDILFVSPSKTYTIYD